jgi:methionyl-tRNA formyltransferase
MLSVLYAGSPAPAARTLELLIENASGYGYTVAGVLTNPPSTQGRHKTLIPTPVQIVAEKNAIPVFTPEHLDTACREEIAAVSPALLVCFAYGHIFGPKFLALFEYGGINLHPSLLPKYRGCTPVNAAIFNGDAETGITVQHISAGMDEGNILAQEKVPLDGTETAGSLLMYSAEHGAHLICTVIAEAVQNRQLPVGKLQQGEPSYTGMLTKESGRIDWRMSAEKIDAQIRACSPDPGCWTMENNEPLKILAAHPVISGASTAVPGIVTAFDSDNGILIATGNGILAVTELQRQGKNAVTARDFMNGARDFVGMVLV